MSRFTSKDTFKSREIGKRIKTGLIGTRDGIHKDAKLRVKTLDYSKTLNLFLQILDFFSMFTNRVVKRFLVRQIFFVTILLYNPKAGLDFHRDFCLF